MGDMDQDQSDFKASKITKIQLHAPGYRVNQQCVKIPGYKYGKAQCWCAFILTLILTIAIRSLM